MQGAYALGVQLTGDVEVAHILVDVHIENAADDLSPLLIDHKFAVPHIIAQRRT